MPITPRNGECFISLLVDREGRPQDIHVVHCTETIFERNSLDAVSQYRFKPAYRESDHTAVPVRVTIAVNFRLGDAPTPLSEPPVEIGYGFYPPPGTTSGDPDANGTYSLSQRLEPPTMTRFVSKGFGSAAKPFPDGASCKVVLVLDAKGKPVNASVSQCDKPVLEQPAIDSLMRSKFKPAKLNGQDVAVRKLVSLVYPGSVRRDANHPAQ